MRSKKISGITYSNTSLTEEAKAFSELWDLKFFENIPLEKFPLVKCNVVEKNGAKVFHLPFDPNYDSAPKSGERNEGYAETVEEAVKKGYRRML